MMSLEFRTQHARAVDSPAGLLVSAIVSAASTSFGRAQRRRLTHRQGKRYTTRHELSELTARGIDPNAEPVGEPEIIRGTDETNTSICMGRVPSPAAAGQLPGWRDGQQHQCGQQHQWSRDAGRGGAVSLKAPPFGGYPHRGEAPAGLRRHIASRASTVAAERSARWPHGAADLARSCRPPIEHTGGPWPTTTSSGETRKQPRGCAAQDGADQLLRRGRHADQGAGHVRGRRSVDRAGNASARGHHRLKFRGRGGGGKCEGAAAGTVMHSGGFGPR